MKVHVLDDWFDTLQCLPCFEKLSDHDVKIWTDHVEDTDELAARLQEAEALVLFRERTKITRDLVEKLPNLKLISQRSVYPHVDVQACSDNGVLLCSNMHGGTPSYAAAELTWALIMAGMRDLPAQMASVKAGHWQAGVGKTLRGRQLGLYGYGRIARAVAGYAEAFGMNVVWWSSDEGRARAKADGVQVAESREAFFALSDVVSVHVRLKSDTHGIITASDFAQMRSGALFVNTSRAGLIVKDALLEALNAGHPGKAAIDVFDTEPLTDPNDPLLSHPNLIATPHIGFVTEDEFDLQFSDIFDQVNAYSENAPVHMINPEVWTSAK
ncbi:MULTISPECIES: D-2-hydroxyacid dehydrogenase family protein [unclassified Ruegeria]|uniref:D-2-hydroxyacid dehydrogenase family protein n=1 Tax=unclassified Ruegeria TaxID=2625375 RepID=UPI0014886975|nr:MULTISPECIES: D-2-hydroxyacid dehydrogenase family protein [unclassified Ruegeria]NOD75646.1 D-2-hydroxyacid dehydrogenase family protein [Ruegeria sp. HKCCD4332]NOD89043.1 D-2-hydroxyacid dehydrogenase family protein [Ruegeria sp. HKCCD4318]NOE14371.1 D-2-hydroxyacid dehydrogenase family protein [Ruegeria sp. HKCCD4318-2]NOG10107.1 D-2-hydroxyacid dehydrogenase family protein [Ruegeria sp. HKCCD4315]